MVKSGLSDQTTAEQVVPTTAVVLDAQEVYIA